MRVQCCPYFFDQIFCYDVLYLTLLQKKFKIDSNRDCGNSLKVQGTQYMTYLAARVFIVMGVLSDQMMQILLTIQSKFHMSGVNVV